MEALKFESVGSDNRLLCSLISILRPIQRRTGPYETQDQFMSRLNRLVGKAIGEAEIEQKFDVDFCAKTGKNEFDEVFKTGKAISKNKLEKRRERNRKRKEKRRGKSSQHRTDEFGDALDKSGRSRIAFGDVVHQPPDLDKIKMAFDAKIKKHQNEKRRVRHFST